MGNIVSDAVVPNQLPLATAGGSVSASPTGGVSAPVSATPPVSAEPSTATPTSPVITTPNPASIEPVETVQTGSFKADPFGAPSPQPDSSETPPDLPELPSISPEQPLAGEPQPFITSPAESEADGGVTRRSAAELLSKMPDISQMMKDLEKSGCLLPELQIKSTEHIDTSPLAALQPKHLKEQSFFSQPSDQPVKKILPEVQLATTHSPQRSQPQELPLYVFVAVVSIVQGIQGLAQAAHFALVKFPAYEQMIVAGVIDTTDSDTAVVKAIIVGIMAVLGLLFGILLILKRSKNRSVDLYLVISIVVINFIIQNILAQKVLASGNPLQFPEIIGEILSRPQL